MPSTPPARLLHDARRPPPGPQFSSHLLVNCRTLVTSTKQRTRSNRSISNTRRPSNTPPHLPLTPAAPRPRVTSNHRLSRPPPSEAYSPATSLFGTRPLPSSSPSSSSVSCPLPFFSSFFSYSYSFPFPFSFPLPLLLPLSLPLSLPFPLLLHLLLLLSSPLPVIPHHLLAIMSDQLQRLPHRWPTEHAHLRLKLTAHVVERRCS